MEKLISRQTLFKSSLVLATFFIAILFPWLYRLIMAKKLKDWDQNYASESEKQLIANTQF